MPAAAAWFSPPTRSGAGGIRAAGPRPGLGLVGSSMANSRRALPPSLWSGNERLRIGERLQASLAGIFELELLRETQREAVGRALASSPDAQQEDLSTNFGNKKLSPAASATTTTTTLDRSKSEDLLGTPKVARAAYRSSENILTDPRGLPAQSGDRSDKGCYGLQMVGEQLLAQKKAGTNGTETNEIVEADSRPSSGFYETSEMGSLSDSCASVHSDGGGGSRCSVGSLSHLPSLRENGFVRPHSTDEAAVRLLDLQLQRLTLVKSAGTDSRRPVSTGDLEFLLGLEELSLPLPKNTSLHLLQYKSDLVSRNTNEIYHYPSPLHAVALQSPLFTSGLSRSSSQEDFEEASLERVEIPSPKREAFCSAEQQRVRLDQYVAKLVLRYKCRSAAGRVDPGYLAGGQKSLSMSSVCSSVLGASQLLAPAPGWKIRRRISTCSHLRSPEGSEGARDSRVLDSQGDFTPFLEIVSLQPGAANLSKTIEHSIVSLPETLPSFPEPSGVPYPTKQPNGMEKRVSGLASEESQVETPCKRGPQVPQSATHFDKLYKGKHVSRELVKAAERQEKRAERSWLNPRELLRRLSLRRRSSTRISNRARASSEINVHVAAGLACHSDPQPGRGKGVKPKWTSVLEISSKTSGRQQLRAGAFHPPHLLNRHLAFSSDSPASFCFLGGSHLDLPPRRRGGLSGHGSSLSKVDATSAVSLNGDWILHPLGDRWSHAAATLDSTDLPVGGFKLHRSRSFKELKKMMSRSFKGSRIAK